MPDKTVHSICILKSLSWQDAVAVITVAPSCLFQNKSNHRLNLASKVIHCFYIWGPCKNMSSQSCLPETSPSVPPYITSSPRVCFWSGNTVTVSKCYCTVVVWALCTQYMCLFMDDRLWWWTHKANVVSELLSQYHLEVLDHLHRLNLLTWAPPPLSPSPTLPYFDLLSKLKEPLWGIHYDRLNELEGTVNGKVRRINLSCLETGIEVLLWRWNFAIQS